MPSWAGMDERRGVWLILAAAALWGTTGTAQALGPVESHPIGVGLMRLVVASPALLAAAWWRDSLPGLGAIRNGSIVLAAVGMAAYQPAFFTAVRLTGVGLGTVVAIGSAPIITGGLVWALGMGRPGPRWWSATVLALNGVLLLTLAGRQLGVDPAGLGFALLAGLCFAVYILASRRAIRDRSPLGATALIFSLAAALSLPLALVTDTSWVVTPSGSVMVIHLGLVATALAYVLFAGGLRHTLPATAATAALAEPVTATVLGVVVVGERPGLVAWAGAGLVLAGLAVLVRAQDSRG